MEYVNYLMEHSSLQREGHSLITSRTTEACEEIIWETRLKECRHCTYSNFTSNLTIEPLL